MAKVSKTYSAPYGGMSEQNDELVLDILCKDMTNCIPDVVLGVQRRNGTEYVGTFPKAVSLFHNYDRGEGNERYLFGLNTTTGALEVYDDNGVAKRVTYSVEATIKSYLGTDSSNLKAITVQDRTFIVNKEKVTAIGTTSALNTNYDRVAYYWLSRASNDSNNKYNYAVYLNNTTFQFASEKSDVAATGLAGLINANAAFTATAKGSIIKITRTDGADFTFSSWDSWGSQASFGWKGSVAKLSDLPNDIEFSNIYVEITGNDNSEFTNYFVRWNGRTWEETKDPKETRGSFSNMPIAVDRLADGTFQATLIDWSEPQVGDDVTNPTPSFIGRKLTNIFFFKNRLGFSSGDNMVMSRLGNYYNFYITTALEVLDTDPIDITIATSKASRIYDVTPFQSQLYMLTRDEQFTIQQDGAFSPTGISVVPVSSYSVDTSIEAMPMGDSLFFLSLNSEANRIVREYKIDRNTLTNIGNNVTLTVPRLIKEVDQAVTSTGNNMLFLKDKVNPRLLYVYKLTKNGDEVIQSAWSKWEFSFDISYMFVWADELYLVNNNQHILKLSLVPTLDARVDSIDSTTTVSFESSVELHKWLPKVKQDLGTFLVPVQVTRVSFYASGKFDVDITRQSYNNYTYTRTFESGSTANMSASVTSKSDDLVLKLKNSDDNNFILSSIIFEGFYTPLSREIQ